MNKEKIKIKTFGDIFHNLETEEQAFEFLKYIKNLQQENKQLQEKLDKYENPEDMTLMYMWCNEKAKDKIKQLNSCQEEIRRLKKQLEDYKKI